MSANTARAFGSLAKRVLLLAFDLLCLGLIAGIALSGVPAQAYAYVDPSVMTYTIQAVAGVAVALSAVAGVAFRRSRKAIMRLLHIDENAKKAVDPHWSEVQDAEGNRYNTCGTEQYLAKVTGRGAEEGAKAEEAGIPLRRRILLALAVAAFVVITLLIIAPFEILAGNEGSLVFRLADAWRPIVLMAVAVLAALTVILSVLRGRAFNIGLLIVFCFGLGCYLQALFLNAGLPSTDGRPVTWGGFWSQALISTLVWVAIFIIPFLFSRKNRNMTQIVVGIVSVALIVVQSVASVSLVVDKIGERVISSDGQVPASMYQVTKRGMFTVSPEKNTIVLVLDTYDTTDMEQLLKDRPEFAEKLQGFTWYKDSVGSMCPTRYGAPFLWTGVYPDANEPLEEFIANRYRRSSFLSDVQNAGYSIGLYTDPIGDFNLPDNERRELIYDKTININPLASEDGTSFLDDAGTMGIMLQASLYRNLPWLVKPFVYFNTDQMNQAMIADGISISDNMPYIIEDTRWFRELKDQGLSLESGDYKGAYRFIHLYGTHIPYYVTAEGEHAGGETSLEEQAQGSMTMVTYYLDELKRLGVYEDATIIITADHGIWWETDPNAEPWLSSPLMLVKPAGVSEGDLTTSDAQVEAYDVLPTVIASMGGDASAYGPTIFEQPNDGRLRRYIYTFTLSNVDLLLKDYHVNGNVANESSWTATGIEWDGTNVPH